MDQLLAGLLSFPPHPPPAKPLSHEQYDSQIQALLKQLNSTPASQLLKPINGTDSILTVLDPSQNPLPYLFALLAQINAAKKAGTASLDASLWAGIDKFVHDFDPVQVRYVGPGWKALVDELLGLALRSNDPTVTTEALRLVEQAMLRLDPGTSTFISTHLDLVKVCLKKKAYHSCLRILANDIFHFPSDLEKHLPLLCATHLTSSTFMTVANGFTNKLHYRDYLQYFVLGSMVLISQRAWSRALSLLELVLVAPVIGNTVSMIQVEAYKKWVLVHILHHGRPASKLPGNISPQVSKLLNSLTKPYTVLAEAFKEQSPARLRAEYTVAAEQHLWRRDSNQGLVRLVLAAHRRSQVLAYSKIYSSISIQTLSDMMSSSVPAAQREEPSAIEADLRQLIGTRSIHATITPGRDGSEVIRFLSTTGEAPVSDEQQAADLQQSIVRVKALGIHVKDAQSRLEYSKEYIEATKKRRKPGKDGEIGVNVYDSVGSGVQMMDEDLMADM